MVFYLQDMQRINTYGTGFAKRTIRYESISKSQAVTERAPEIFYFPFDIRKLHLLLDFRCLILPVITQKQKPAVFNR